MSVVTADRSLQNLFATLKEKTEVRDDSGNLLGFLTPTEVELELLYQHAEAVFDPDETERLLQEQTEGYSIEQVMAHLQSLEKR